MSLINQMLQDLDRRRAGEEGAAAPPLVGLRAAPRARERAEPRAGRWRPTAAALASVGVAAFVLSFVFGDPQPPGPPSGPPHGGDAAEARSVAPVSAGAAHALPPAPRLERLALEPVAQGVRVRLAFDREATPRLETRAGGRTLRLRLPKSVLAAELLRPVPDGRVLRALALRAEGEDVVLELRAAGPRPLESRWEPTGNGAEWVMELQPGRLPPPPRAAVPRVPLPTPVRVEPAAPVGMERTLRARAPGSDAARAHADAPPSRERGDMSNAEEAFEKARLLVEAGRLADAIQTLEAVVPALAEAPDHHAFLAALYQRRGEHERAVRRYGEALGVRPQQALWWMGLGISLEQTGHAEAALGAYRKASALGLEQAPRAYVGTRIEALAARSEATAPVAAGGSAR